MRETKRKSDLEGLRADIDLLRSDFDAHNHDGSSSRSFQTLLAETLSARALSIRKTAYTDTNSGLWAGLVGSTPKFYLGSATDYFKFDGTNLNIALASGGINIDGGSLTITQSIGNLLLNSSGLLFKVTTYENANIILSSGSGPVGAGVQLRFCVGGGSGGTAAQIDFTYASSNTGNFSPKSGNSIDLGTASSYFQGINYKDLYDRGCLGFFDEGVELLDGRKVTDIEALESIQKDMTKNTRYGVPMLDYATMPKAVYTPAPIAQEDTYEEGKLRWKKGEKMGDDASELGALVSIMLGAIKELSTKVKDLESKIKI